MLIRVAYERYDRVFGLPDVYEDSLTRKSFADECDVNSIIRQFKNTGQILHVMNSPCEFLVDFTGNDFQTAMNLVANASSSFQDLPAKIRERFSNSPVKYMDFVNDPGNVLEMQELGMLRADYQSPEQIKALKAADAHVAAEAFMALSSNVDLSAANGKSDNLP